MDHQVVIPPDIQLTFPGTANQHPPQATGAILALIDGIEIMDLVEYIEKD